MCSVTGILVLLLHIITYLCILLHTWGFQLDFLAEGDVGSEDWYRAKNKLNWNRPKSCSALESVLWVLILDLSRTQLNAILLEDSLALEKVNFWHFEETTNLILSWYWVEAELRLRLNWPGTGLRRCPAIGGWCHWHWHTKYNFYICQWLSRTN